LFLASDKLGAGHWSDDLKTKLVSDSARNARLWDHGGCP
jgi:hypothetical protein